MKFVLSFAAALCAASLMAVDSFTTDFTQAAGAKQWGRDPYAALNPFPKFGFDAQEKAFVVGKVTKSAANFLSKPKIDVKTGDVLVVKVEAKGTGNFTVSTENYGIKNGKKNSYLGVGADARSFQLTNEWKKVELKLTIRDRVKDATTEKVVMSFRVNKDGEFMIRSFSVEKQAAK